MRKRIILMGIIVVIMGASIFLPYRSYTFTSFFGESTEDKERMTEDVSGYLRWHFPKFTKTTMRENIVGLSLYLLFVFSLIFPLIFVGESFLLKMPFRLRIKLLFITQSIIVLLGTGWTCLVFSPSLFSLLLVEENSIYLPPYYIIVYTELLFALWSILLIIPKIRGLKVIRFLFDQS